MPELENIIQIMPTDWKSVWVDLSEEHRVAFLPLAGFALVKKQNETVIIGIEPNEDGIIDLTPEDESSFMGYAHPKILEDGPGLTSWRQKAQEMLPERDDGLEEETE